jgi:O-antigen ligase
MLSEFYTGHNIFSVFGGVPEKTVVRNGRLRCQGAFIHPLMAGAYGGTLFPLFYILMIQKKALSRLFGVLGIAGSIVVTVLTASSGPVLSLFAGIIGLVAWPIRYHMKKIKLIVIFMLVFLHLVMKAPVWALVARVSTIDGSTGYHRFYIIDQAIKRFGEWWFLGTKSTAHWGYGLWDVTNQYVVEAVKGGLLGLILFLGLIISAFRIIGKSIENPDLDEQTKKTFWAMGSALLHTLLFFLD